MAVCPQEKGFASDITHVTYFDLSRLSELMSEVGLRIVKRASFPLPRFAGKLFIYNEHVVVATKIA